MHISPRWILAATAGATLLVSAPARAADPEYGKVISKVAIYNQVQVPQQQCTQQQVLVQQPNSGAGAVVGAVAGGVIGSAVGKGAGSAVATGVGAIAGAIMGDKAESNANPPRASTMQSCQTVQTTEQRFAGYDVTYEYMGRQYTSRVAHDPGERIALVVNVTPVDAIASTPPVVTTTQPVSTAPQVIYTAPPVVYQPAPAYWWPSVGINLGWGWGGRHR